MNVGDLVKIVVPSLILGDVAKERLGQTGEITRIDGSLQHPIQVRFLEPDTENRLTMNFAPNELELLFQV